MVKSILDYFTRRARENKFTALMLFNKWLASPDGAIIWPHLFKEEYRELAVDIAYYYLAIASKIFINLLETQK